MSIEDNQLNMLHKISNILENIKGTSEKSLLVSENHAHMMNNIPEKMSKKMPKHDNKDMCDMMDKMLEEMKKPCDLSIKLILK